jgi:hypothetical protein
MNYWAVDDANVDQSNNLTIISKLFVNIKRSDEIILFKRLTRKEIEFHSRAIIVEAQTSRYGENKQKFLAHLASIRSLKNSSLLSEITYSLKKIYRYRQAYRHFPRKYLRLNRDDFNTIISGSIYWARTAFGIYGNMLTSKQFGHFIQEAAISTPEIFVRQWDYDLAWKVLRQFIEDQYITAGELLQAIHAKVAQIQRENMPDLDYMKLGIYSDEDDKNDLLYDQEKLLTEFLALTRQDGVDVLEELSHKIVEASNSEPGFQKIFQNTPWPLQLIEE